MFEKKVKHRANDASNDVIAHPYARVLDACIHDARVHDAFIYDARIHDLSLSDSHYF